MCVLYACKKEDHASDTNTSVQSGTDQQGKQQPTIANRSTGTQVFYSRNEDGTVYYKMELVWSTGAVTVNRSVVTSGYPADTQNWLKIEDGISVSEIGDTIRVCYESGKQYYQIAFEPSTDGGGYIASGTTGGCRDHICHCSASSSWGSSCEKTSTSNGFYCSGCQKCTMEHVPDVFDFTSGSYILEATDISIIN